MELYIGKFHFHKYLSGCQEGCPFLISDLHVRQQDTRTHFLVPLHKLPDGSLPGEGQYLKKVLEK